jgi:integrase
MRRSGVRISSQAPGQSRCGQKAFHIESISGTLTYMAKGSRRRIRGRGETAVWQLRAYAGRSPVTGKHVYVSRTVHGNADAADEGLAELVAEVAGGDHDGNQATFGSLLDRWVKHAAVLKDLSPTTVREHERTIDKTIRPVLGDTELRKLDGRALDAFYAQLRTREKPLAPASVRRVHAVISAACTQGVKWGELKVNPANHATPPGVRHAPKAVPTPEAIQALIKAAQADDPDMASLIALAAVTGARRGELLGLRWSDWDGVAGTLTIERSVATIKGDLLIKPTKTYGVRRLACDPFTDEVLKRHRAMMEERADDAGVELADDGPVFSYDLERPIHPDTVSHYVRDLADKAKVDIHLHQLRHFAATQLVSGGVDVRTVAGRLGHADASTTLRVYSHALPERDREAAESLGKALAGA